MEKEPIKKIPKKEISVEELFGLMLQKMGPQGWWPAESKWEIILGAVLVQNTNWRNVEHSLASLEKATHFDPQKIQELTLENLSDLIRPSGFYRAKAQTIKNVFDWLAERDFDLIMDSSTNFQNLRAQLLNLKGIGNETGDALMLYVFDQPGFIADAYARRIFAFLGMSIPKSYKQFKALIEKELRLSLS